MDYKKEYEDLKTRYEVALEIIQGHERSLLQQKKCPKLKEDGYCVIIGRDVFDLLNNG